MLPPREGSLKRNKSKSKSTTSPPILYNTPKTRYDTEWNGMLIPMLGKLPSGFLRSVSLVVCNNLWCVLIDVVPDVNLSCCLQRFSACSVWIVCVVVVVFYT